MSPDGCSFRVVRENIDPRRMFINVSRYKINFKYFGFFLNKFPSYFHSHNQFLHQKQKEKNNYTKIYIEVKKKLIRKGRRRDVKNHTYQRKIV